MASLRLRHPDNTPGDFFVDTTCIDCDLCRQIAPASFQSSGDQSVVHQQPASAVEELAAMKALVSCPTASIGAVPKHSVQAALEALPEPIDGGVHFCGFAAESSFGASSYLVVRPEGNVLVDSPRFASQLVKRIEALGGIRLLFLTHRDDVADHAKWAAHFGAERVMHAADAGAAGGKLEQVLDGLQARILAPDLLAIPTPGHTRGHMVLLYEQRYLFTGDHVWWSPTRQGLSASRDVCWYSWTEQIRSMQRLLDYGFEWVLPGHGRRAHASAEQMHRQLQLCIERMQQQALRHVAVRIGP